MKSAALDDVGRRGEALSVCRMAVRVAESANDQYQIEQARRQPVELGATER
jgi:hypothetical protein